MVESYTRNVLPKHKLSSSSPTYRLHQTHQDLQKTHYHHLYQDLLQDLHCLSTVTFTVTFATFPTTLFFIGVTDEQEALCLLFSRWWLEL